MKENKKSEIRVGITVIIGFILLTWLFVWSKNVSVFNDDIHLKVEFNSVAGLETGDAVTISGLKKGYVKDINIEKNKVFVTMFLNKNIELREDAKFYIQMADLMGTKKIDIEPGIKNKILDYSKIQNGHFSGDISTAMAMLSSVQNDLVAVIKDFRVTLDNVNHLFDDKELQNDIKSSFTNLNKLSIDLSELIKENKKSINDLLVEGKKLTEAGSEFLKDNTSEVQLFMKKSNQVFENLNSLIVKSDKLVDETSSGKNNLGKILNDENLFNEMKTSILELKKLLQIFNKQLEGEGLKVDAYIF